LSEAAAQLNVSPSAVSKSLAAMEDTLGTTLIKRTTRSITLTDAGQYLFNRANKLLKEFDETLNTTSGYYHSPQGELRITCSIAFGYSRLVNLVDKYRSQFPDVNLYIDLNDNFVNLNETDFDIALRPHRRKTMRCASWCLFAGRTVPHPATSQKGMPQRRSDLVDHDCLVYPASRRC
jgi:DNA-binding transcriptional LysR family regulator